MQITPKYLEILKIVIKIISWKEPGIVLNACLIAIYIPNQDSVPNLAVVPIYQNIAGFSGQSSRGKPISRDIDDGEEKESPGKIRWPAPDKKLTNQWCCRSDPIWQAQQRSLFSVAEYSSIA